MAKVDIYRYDESWERLPTDLLPRFYEPLEAVKAYSWTAIKAKPKSYVIDLRKKVDYESWHLPDALNIPLNSLTSGKPSPFAEPKVLEAQWLELEDIFGHIKNASSFNARRVLVLCYNGDTARVAASILRAKGVEADCVRGGYQAINAIVAGDLAGEPEPRLSALKQDVLV